MKPISKNKICNKLISGILISVMAIAGIGFVDLPLSARAEFTGPTEFDITKGSVRIDKYTTSGFQATGKAPDGSTIAETAVNPYGYVIKGNSIPTANFALLAADVDVKLVDVKIKANVYSGIFIGVAAKNPAQNKTATVKLTLEGENEVDISGYTVKAPAAIDVPLGSSLTIEGGGSLLAKGGRDSAGIGSSVNKPAGSIVINSGRIHAVSGTSSDIGGLPAAIGGGKNALAKDIVINGGTVVADSIEKTSGEKSWGIGDGILTEAREQAIRINGGSIMGRVQGEPVNSSSEYVYPLLITAPGLNDEYVKVLMDESSGAITDVYTDSESQVRIYFPSRDRVIALYHGADLYYANDVHIGTVNSVTLTKYSGAPCSCDVSNASLSFPDEVININTTIVQPVNKPLSAEFQKCDSCTYPIHIATELNYSFDATPPDASKARILPGGILQVFKDAVGISPLRVKASMKVNNVLYEKVAEFIINPVSDIELDLAEASVIVDGETITHGANVYTVPLAQPLKIVQSNSHIPTSNYIKIMGAARTGAIEIKKLNIKNTNDASTIPAGISVYSDTELKLEDENSIDERGRNEHCGILVDTACTLTISGNGGLMIKAGDRAAGIGDVTGGAAVGNVVIESGNIEAHGGALAAGIGSSRRNSGGSITVKGGVVKAYGGQQASGIGAGYESKMMNVRIENGDVFAAGGEGAAGLTGGDSIGGSGIIISGGMVKSKPGTVYNGITPPAMGGTNARTQIKGGRIEADIAGSTNASVDGEFIVDGGSVILKNPSATQPVNELGQRVYAKWLVTEELAPNTDVNITHHVETDPLTTHTYKSKTDALGRVCVFTPGGAEWDRYVINTGAVSYYKRFNPEDHNDIEAACIPDATPLICVSAPKKLMTSFELAGQKAPAIITGQDINLELIKGVPLNVAYVPKIIFEGSQCIPEGAQNFSAHVNQAGNPFLYTIIADDGSSIVYNLNITQEPVAVGEPPVFDVSMGDINVYASRVDVVSGADIYSFPIDALGFALSGSSEDRQIIIHETPSGPIIFDSLNMKGNTGKSPVKVAASSAGTNAIVKLRGKSILHGFAEAVPAIDLTGSSKGSEKAAISFESETLSNPGYLEASGGANAPAVGAAAFSENASTIKGCGRVEIKNGNYKLTGGSNAPAIGLHAAGSYSSGTGEIIIDGGNVRLLNGGGYTGYSLHHQPVNGGGQSLGLIEVTVAKEGLMQNQSIKLKYESLNDDGTISNHDEEVLLTDENGKVYIYTTEAKQRVIVTDPATAQTYFGEAAKKPGASLRKILVSKDSGEIKSLTFKDPLTYKATPVKFVMKGTGLFGTLELKAKLRGETWETTKTFVDKGSQYEAIVDFPENTSSTSASVYDISVLINGVEQAEPKKTYSKHKKLVLNDFVLPNQVGSTNIGSITAGGIGVSDTVDLDIVMPYDLVDAAELKLVPASIAHSGSKIIPAADAENDFKVNTNYTIHGASASGHSAVDKLICNIMLTYEAEPIINRFTVYPKTYPSVGGTANLTLFGANLGNLANAYSGEKKIEVALIKVADGSTIEKKEAILQGTSRKVNFTLPSNYEDTAVAYGFKVKVNGKLQDLSGDNSPTVSVAKYDKPRVNSVSIAPQQSAITYKGGTLKVTANGSYLNPATLAMIPTGDKKLKIKLGELGEREATFSAGKYTAVFELPPCNSYTEDKVYPIEVKLSGEQQILTGISEIIVPHQKKPRITSVAIPAGITYKGLNNCELVFSGENFEYIDSIWNEDNKKVMVTLGSLGTKEAVRVGDEYKVSFDIPKCNSYTDADEYMISVNFNGEAQVLGGITKITVPHQKKPRITSVMLSAPLEYEGGTCSLEFAGENFDYIDDIWVPGDKKVKVSLGGLDTGEKEAVFDNTTSTFKVSFDLPKNKSYTEDKSYPVSVKLNGEVQSLAPAGAAAVVKKQPKPVVTDIVLTVLTPDPKDPGSGNVAAGGGRVRVELDGSRLDKLDDAPSGVPAVITVGADKISGNNPGDVSSVPAVEVSGKWTAELTLPANPDFLINNVYKVWVKIDDEKQSPLGADEITVARTLEGNNLIRSMRVDKQIGETKIDHVAGTVKIIVPSGTDMRRIAPVIELAGVDATVSPESAAIVDFTRSPVKYTVTAGNGTQKIYDVSIAKQRRAKKAFETKYSVKSDEKVENIPYLKGFEDNSFRPGKKITRGEVAMLFASLSAGYDSEKTYKIPFADVPGDKWYAKAVGYVYEQGIVNGYNSNLFAPDAPVTRQEFAAILMRYASKNLMKKELAVSIGYEQELLLIKAVNEVKASFNANLVPEEEILEAIEERVNAELERLNKPVGDGASGRKSKAPFVDISGTWGREYIDEMYNKAWISGYEDGTFRPNSHITRAESAKIINSFMGRVPDKAAIDGCANAFTDVTQSHWAYYEIMAASAKYMWQREKLLIEKN